MLSEPPPSRPLGVHVLGPGYGESIVLELPDGTVGVIDTFRNPQGSVPVIDFLERRLARPKVRFLAVTHPHADHCQGLWEFVEKFEADEYFVFDSFQETDLFSFFKMLFKHRTRDAVEEALELRPGTVLLQLAKFNKYLEDEIIKHSPFRLKLLRFPRLRRMCGGEVYLRFLTPGDAESRSYKSKLFDSLKAAVSDGPRVNEHWKSAASINHNLVSGSMLVGYGKTRVLLMSDGEIPLWNELLASLGENQESLPAPVQLVKVAHHGSTNGYVAALYDSLCRMGSTLAVVTPFSRHESPLPKGEGLRNLRGHAASIFCTNRSAAAQSSGLRWEPTSSALLESFPATPTRWLTLLASNPALKGFLAPRLGGPASLEPGVAFPLDFLPECVQSPRLLQLLHPDLRNAWITAQRSSTFDEFRVSFYFDKDGREDESRRYIGWGAGKLADHQ